MKIGRSTSRHLSSSDLIDHSTICPVCLSTGSRKPVFRIQSDPDIDMLECSTCRACSASQMPRPEVLQEYYGTYYCGHRHAVRFTEPDRFPRHILGSIDVSSLPDTASILDFGGGDGTLSHAIAVELLAARRASRVEIILMDFPTPLVASDPRITLRHRSPFEPIDGTFDLVLASGVLEHVPEVHGLMNALYAAIADGGYFYARTPYAIPFRHILPNLDLTYPAHVHDMGSPFWNRVTESFGWDAHVVASRPSIVESSMHGEALKTIAAVVMKLPAHIENWLSPRSRKDRFWHLVGGWEVFLQRAR